MYQLTAMNSTYKKKKLVSLAYKFVAAEDGKLL